MVGIRSHSRSSTLTRAGIHRTWVFLPSKLLQQDLGLPSLFPLPLHTEQSRRQAPVSRDHGVYPQASYYRIHALAPLPFLHRAVAVLHRDKKARLHLQCTGLPLVVPLHRSFYWGTYHFFWKSLLPSFLVLGPYVSIVRWVGSLFEFQLHLPRRVSSKKGNEIKTCQESCQRFLPSYAEARAQKL